MSGSVTKHVVSEQREVLVSREQVEQQVVASQREVLVSREQVEQQIVAIGTQGPRGGVGGILGGVDTITPADIGALAIAARLSEFDTEQARIDARTNLGVQIIDAGTFN